MIILPSLRRCAILASTALASIISLSAQYTLHLNDSIKRHSEVLDNRARYPYINPIEMTLKRTLPLIAISTSYSLISNSNIATARSEFFSNFRHHYDDFCQFAPLLTQVGLHVAGTQGRSQHTLELASANLITSGIMLWVVTLGKSLTHVERPDGSARNSFPSGHTAMAFASATMLHLEYGKRYPWLSALGYGVATSVGLGRILNNRHWIGDVATGAFIGVLSGEIGYWLNDRLWKRGKDYLQSKDLPTLYKGLTISLPGRIALGTDIQQQQTGLGLHWRYSDRGYYLFSNLLLEIEQLNNLPIGFIDDSNIAYARNASWEIGWGKEWSIYSNWFTADTGVSLGIDALLKLYPSVHLSPRLYLSQHFAIRADLIYSHRKAIYEVESNELIYGYRLPQFIIGSAIEFRL